MFKLVRYFSVASLIVLVGVTVVLITVYRQVTVEELVEIQENQNVTLTQAFANQIWPDFEGFLTSNSETSGDDLRSHPQTAKLRSAVVELMSGLPVLKVKIYDMTGLTDFSTEGRQIGDSK